MSGALSHVDVSSGGYNIFLPHLVSSIGYFHSRFDFSQLSKSASKSTHF